LHQETKQMTSSDKLESIALRWTTKFKCLTFQDKQ
jgi:hypothetical protein